MKKNLLLTIIPALMVLSACAGTAPKQEVIPQEPEFAEDTLAHEEIFGNIGQQVKLTPYKDPYVSSDPSLKTPLVGVQYKDDGDGKFAIRYVAAISALDVEATWVRGICNSSGVQQLTGNDKFVEKPVTYAYKAVSADNGSGDAYTTPESVDSDFHYFVVYTLREVPAEHVNSYLFAYLKLTKGAETVRSLARISKVDGGKTFTFDTESSIEYFIQGTIGGTPDRTLPINDSPTGTNYAQEEEFTLSANDMFGLFKCGSDHFQCFGYNQLRRGAQFFSKVSSSNYIKVPGAGKYNLYLTNSNEVHIVAPDTAKGSAKFYFSPGTNWGTSARYALNAFNNAANPKTQKWMPLTQIGTSGIYTCDAFDATEWPEFQLVRLNPGTATYNWDGDWWSKTGNLSASDVGNIFYVNNNASTNRDDTAEGNWNLYLA